MSRLRAVSLFSNCGAGDVGYSDAGFHFEVMAELDPRRLEVALLNHPGALGIAGDLRKTWPKVIKAYRERGGDKRPALLCACPPCQGMSSARGGKGRHADANAGSKDERNLLVVVIEKVALSLQPSVIVVENVQAFLNRRVRHPKNGRPISAANYLIEALAQDYLVAPLVADLSEFGVPQSRKRAFLTFLRRDLRCVPRLGELGRAPYPRPNASADSSLNLINALKSFKLPTLDAANERKATAPGFGGMHVVPIWDERTYAMVAAIPSRSGRSAWDNNVCFECGEVDIGESDATCPDCGHALLRPVVRAANGKHRLVKGFKTSYRRMYPDRPAATITTASGHVGSDYTIHPTENRLLSPLECAFLQTFPKSFKWGDALERFGPTTVRDMIGEAVPPLFTRAHGQVLAGLLRGEWKRAPISLSDEHVTRGWDKLQTAAIEDQGDDGSALLSAAELKTHD